MKSVVQDLISSLKQGRKGRLQRNYRINLVEFMFVYKFQSYCHLLLIYRLIIGNRYSNNWFI